jgi:group I intron endonuclease
MINKINGKAYIGKTNDFHGRMIEHSGAAKRGKSTKIYNAIRKYGFDQFDNSILESHDNELECFEAEEFWITLLRSQGAELYNMTNGGEGPTGRVTSKETRDKRSAAWVPGKKHHSQKLTEAQVLEIRSLAASGTVTQIALSKRFSVTRRNINEIINRTSWKRLP